MKSPKTSAKYDRMVQEIRDAVEEGAGMKFTARTSAECDRMVRAMRDGASGFMGGFVIDQERG